ncbi:polysaccharide pyruvyl transferase family protein [Photobacterium damselae]|uniref:polysaccharide pyruvyl transferase family protein n=1 Tax=Photobacterium damselae TaxID=38293 RepID=UPI0015941B52|nr:polysaccharide pyruvyl transferase family protein [Photobacterium damselae]NVH48266.1 polysaccharide pyruvyl transferase family protein [Photobacterium damselae subsp. damselae]
MKVSILSHCSHNKGDNSVLGFLNKALPKNINIHISTSSGELPFWFSSNNVTTSMWGCGKRFSVDNESFTKKVIRNLRNKIYDSLSYIVLYLYSQDYDKLALSLLNFIIDEKFSDNLKNSDKVICTGGHHISSVLDKDGVNPQLMDMLYTILCGYDLYLWAQSIGPVNTSKKYITKSISKLLNRTKLICYRDKDSLIFLNDNSVSTRKILVDDSVFGLSMLLNSEKNLEDINPDKDKFIIVALYTAGKKQKNNIDNYLNQFVSPLKNLISEGYKISLLPMQYKGLQDDERSELLKLKELVGSDSIQVLMDDMSPMDTLRYVSSASLLIGHKTHSVVYGLANSIPTIAISYHPKTTYFMHRFSQDDFVIEDDIFSSLILQEKIDKIKSNYNKNLAIENKEIIGKNVIKSFKEILK